MGQKEGSEGRGRHKGGEERGERRDKGGEMAERKGEGKEKTQRNSTTFPCQKHSVQSTVVVSPSVRSP